MEVRSSGFRDWLSGTYYRRTGGAPNTSAIEQALRTAEARAKFDGVERPVYVRVGGDNGSIYIDLADPDWRAVKIDGAGWNVVKNPTVRFVRTKGMLPLALPRARRERWKVTRLYQR
jgi:putative DNA primase/helicase